MNKTVEILLEGKHVDLENMEIVNKKVKQAGLSRATLEISSEFSSYFLLRTHKSQLVQRYSIINIFEVVFH